VRLEDGLVVWLDAGDFSIAPLGHVTAHLAAGDEEGQVFVTPEQILSPPTRIDGVIIHYYSPVQSDQVCTDLPGSEFPTLGETVRRGDVSGIVIALDPVERRVTIAPEDAAPLVVSLDDIPSG
jgi:hypothetical protein